MEEKKLTVGEMMKARRALKKKNKVKRKAGAEVRKAIDDSVKKVVKEAKKEVTKEKRIVDSGKERIDEVKKIASKFAKGKLQLQDREQATLLKRIIDVDTLKRYNMTPKRTMKEYFFIALANLSDYVTWDKDGKLYLKAQDELTYEQTAAIREINTRRDNNTGNYFVTKLKFHDKLSALQDIAKHFGLFEKDNIQKAPQIDIDKIIGSLPGELNEMVRVKLLKEMTKYAEQQGDGGLFGDSDERPPTVN